MFGGIFQFYSNFHRIFCNQTVETLIRPRILWHLIWVCTVCLCPIKRTLGLYWLNANDLNAISKFRMENDCAAQKWFKARNRFGTFWVSVNFNLVFILLGLVVVYNLESNESITFYRDAYSYFGQTLCFK